MSYKDKARLNKNLEIAANVLENFFDENEICQIPEAINYGDKKYIDNVFDYALRLIKKHKSPEDLKLFLLTSFIFNFDQS